MTTTVRCKMLLSNSVNITALIATCVFVLAINFGISIFALHQIQKFDNELQHTRIIVEELKTILYDLKNFENETNYISDDDYDDYNDDDSNDTYTDDNTFDTENNYEIPYSLQIKVGSEEPRSKRDVLAATRDGVLIKSESYADFKKMNKTRAEDTKSETWQFPKTTLNHYNEKTTPKPAPIISRKSRVMKLEDKSKPLKRVIKKPSLRALSDVQNLDRRIKYYRQKREIFKLPILRYHYSRQEQSSGQEMTIIRDDNAKMYSNRRKHRQRLEILDESTIRLSKLRPQPAIHFSGDTSKYVLGQHHNFKGNGHLRHHSKTFVDWKPENWVKSLGMDQHFTIREGVVTVKEAGLYFIYAQVYYLDEHDTNGYHVYKNNDILLQCTTMVHSTTRIMKGNTCYTGGVAYLSDDDQIQIKDISDSRYSLFEPGKSFFGIVKLGDIKIK